MKNSLFTNKILVFLALFLIALAFAGCSRKDDKKKNIELEIIPTENDFAIGDNVKNEAEKVVFSLLCSYQEKKTGTLKNEAKVKAEKQAKSVIENGEFALEEANYNKAFKIIKKNETEIAKGLVDFMAGDLESGAQLLKPAYKELTKESSSRVLSEIIYQLAICEFDVRYEKQMEAYDRLGTPYLLEKAKEYEKGKELFKSDVGSKNIDALIKYGFVYVELFYGNAFEGNFIDTFSNEEILLFIKELELDQISITDTGWTLLLTAYGEANIKNVSRSFLNRVLFSASQNGDSKSFAHMVKELVSLASIAQEKMTVADIEYLRQGDKNGFLLSLLSNFDENDWKSFDSAMPREIKSDTYISLAKEKYGIEFEAYLETYKTATLEELKSSSGTPDFYKILKEYIAGICPAFSYGMVE